MSVTRERLNAETIVKEEPAMWVDSESVMQNGRLILTSRRLAFMLNGAEKTAISIDLDTINTLSKTSVLVDHNVMAIAYLQYDDVKFSVLNYEEWEKAVEEQRMQPHIKMTNS